MVRDSTEHLSGRAGPVRAVGAAGWIAPRAALALALALHELGTNAAKYGALSGERGRVSIAWRETAEGRLVLDWKEQAARR